MRDEEDNQELLGRATFYFWYGFMAILLKTFVITPFIRRDVYG